MRYSQLPYRLLQLIYALIVLVAAGTALPVSLGWPLPTGWGAAFRADPANRWGAVVVCAFVIIMSIQLLAASLRKHQEPEVTIQETDLGRVDIAASALEDLVRRAAHQVREIREIRPVLHCDREGVVVALHLSVSPAARLPAVTREIQQLVRTYLEDRAGVPVLQVGVRVDRVSGEPHPRVE